MPQARQLDHLGNRVTASPTPRHPLTHRQGLTVLTRRFTACRQPGRRDVTARRGAAPPRIHTVTKRGLRIRRPRSTSIIPGDWSVTHRRRGLCPPAAASPPAQRTATNPTRTDLDHDREGVPRPYPKKDDLDGQQSGHRRWRSGPWRLMVVPSRPWIDEIDMPSPAPEPSGEYLSHGGVGAHDHDHDLSTFGSRPARGL